MNFNNLKLKAEAKGFKAVELTQEIKSGIKLSIFKGKVASSNSYETNVFAIRGLINGKTGVYYSENLESENLDQVLDTIIENSSVITTKEESVFYAGDKEYKYYKEIESDFHKYKLNDKVKKCLELEKAVLESHNSIFSAKVSYEEVSKKVILKNSNGLNLEKHHSYAVLVGEVSCKKDEDVKSSYSYQAVKNFEEFNIEKLRKDVIRDAVKSLGAQTIKSKQYKVILRRDVATDLLSAFSSMFSADSLITKSTPLAGLIDEQVFGRNVTIIDEPLCKKAFFRQSFDDEGVKAVESVIVKNGFFKTFLHNLKTAKKFGTTSTSNGFKANIQSDVTVQPSNLYLKEGPYTITEMYEKCGNGIMITSISGLHSGVNPITGDFNLQAEGYKIESGRISSAVNLIVLSGNIIDVYNKVVMIGDDLIFKGSNIASPTLLIKAMSISGKN